MGFEASIGDPVVPYLEKWAVAHPSSGFQPYIVTETGLVASKWTGNIGEVVDLQATKVAPIAIEAVHKEGGMLHVSGKRFSQGHTHSCFHLPNEAPRDAIYSFIQFLFI
eukprot:gene20679-27474_t